jgi:steroid 5-alpha reductase family enzyme
MAFASVNYAIARSLDDLSIVDITWSLMFLIPNAMILYQRRDSTSGVMLLLAVMLFIWAIRLAGHIFMRHKGEDYRYKMMKKAWENKPAAVQFVWAYL